MYYNSQIKEKITMDGSCRFFSGAVIKAISMNHGHREEGVQPEGKEIFLECMTYQKCCDTAKEVLREKCIAMTTYINNHRDLK
jgi:hypothetical protein